MAFRIIEGSRGNAISINNQKGNVKSFTGFPMEVQTIKTGKGHEKRESRIYIMRTEKGETARVWGTAGIDSCLLNGDGAIKPALIARLVRITWIERIKTGSGGHFNRYRVEVDTSKKAPKEANIPF